MKIKLLVALSLFSSITTAANFGLQGITYPIYEEDLLTVIHRELQRLEKNGSLESLNKQFSAQALKSANRPKPVEGLQRTVSQTKRLIDPSQVLESDAVLPNGQLIAKAGSRVNPFDRMTMTQQIIFINGDDNEQVIWAVEKSKESRSKIVLVQGEPFTLAKKHSAQFYFDQSGYLTSKWGIQQLPAIVKQEGRMLSVEEIKL